MDQKALKGKVTVRNFLIWDSKDVSVTFKPRLVSEGKVGVEKGLSFLNFLGDIDVVVDFLLIVTWVFLYDNEHHRNVEATLDV